ncbi:hypothetical protein B0H67DRAFT_272866 [Lasiosphaeris hirsuta]|uniref:Uncharacterized protein n=1 Tax=Lasiosphaeris hirsuta TaxID=260670 RepID=A0AA40DT71_9PEZI|nr:hypothetical protein B0H67DRAFT_272866 [Lasiosphaeris hirsuta]
MAWGMASIGPGKTSRIISKTSVSYFSSWMTWMPKLRAEMCTNAAGCQTVDRRSDKERQRRLLTRTICDIRLTRVFPAWGKVGSEQKKKRHQHRETPHPPLRATHHTHHKNPTPPARLERWASSTPHSQQLGPRPVAPSSLRVVCIAAPYPEVCFPSVFGVSIQSRDRGLKCRQSAGPTQAETWMATQIPASERRLMWRDVA